MGTEEQSRWIWTPEWTLEDNASPRLVCFRRTVDFSRKPAEVRLRISADTRYKLYINGVFVQDGPARGDRGVWYADETDAAAYLRQGENVFAVEVLRYPMEGTAGNHGMFRTEHPGLYVDCAALYEDGSREEWDNLWLCHVNRSVRFRPEEERFAPLVIHEHAAWDPAAFRWKEPGFDDSGWTAARPYRKH
ncbi:MAG: hypothetical protein IJT94_02785 [Oscillibacter sp.]|nr:hypothetical protein [Oscillibacter sp.]